MKSQIDILKTEISGLKELNVQLQQNLELKTAQEKRLESELDQFKAKEKKAHFERIQADSAHTQAQILLKLEQQLKKQDELWQSMLQQSWNKGGSRIWTRGSRRWWCRCLQKEQESGFRTGSTLKSSLSSLGDFKRRRGNKE